MSNDYVHGYDDRELQRLQDQAGTLVDLLHADTSYPAGHHVLEAGCGVGAQTVTLARRSPGALITAIDVSEPSLAVAREAVERAGLQNVRLHRADILKLPFAPGTFDHVFVCFVLEHLPRRLEVLRALRRVLKVDGTMTVIEGDHGSTYFYPDSAVAHRAIRCLVELQSRGGGDALIGRSLFPLLSEAGFAHVRVSPRMVYADASRPGLVEGFTRKTFTAMVEGIRDDALAAGLIDADTFEQAIAALERTTAPDGVFCYTFFKAVGVKEAG